MPKYHRPWFKVIINTVLRFIQCKCLNPILLISVFEYKRNSITNEIFDEKLIRYKFGRMILK